MIQFFYIYAIVAVLGVGAASCASADIKSSGEGSVKKYAAETFFDTISYLGLTFSEDEKSVLVSSDKPGVFNVFKASIESPGELEQITESESDYKIVVSDFPGDGKFLMTSDSGGNELNHLFLVDKDGSSRDLTPGDNLKASFVGWQSDKQAFFVLANDRDPNYFDLYKYSVATLEREKVFVNNVGWTPMAVSRDGKWLALIKINSNRDSDIYIVNLQDSTKGPELVSDHEGDVSHNVFSFSPDSRSLLYGTNEFGEFTQAWAYDIEEKKKSLYYKKDWNVEYISFSEKGRYRVIGLNEDAQTRALVHDLRTNRELDLGVQGNVISVKFSPSEEKIAFYVQTDTSPKNLYVTDVESQNPIRLTSSLAPEIDEKDLVESEVVRFNSFDGLEIPSLLFKPHAASSDNKVPAVIWVHGGPGGQTRKGYQSFIQHLVNNGYAVLGVNNRGSSGYGKTFYHADDRRHGDVDLKDCIWGRKYLESLPWIQSDKIAIMGGSYGGYMVAAALTFEPDAFDAGINIFGVTNWLRTLKSIPPWWASFRDFLYTEVGHPEKDEEFLRAKSPLFHAANISKPLLVVQGANDPRVLKEESDDLVSEVRRNGVPVEYLLFEDEGHGFMKKSNQISASKAYIEFLNNHL